MQSKVIHPFCQQSSADCGCTKKCTHQCDFCKKQVGCACTNSRKCTHALCSCSFFELVKSDEPHADIFLARHFEYGRCMTLNMAHFALIHNRRGTFSTIIAARGHLADTVILRLLSDLSASALQLLIETHLRGIDDVKLKIKILLHKNLSIEVGRELLTKWFPKNGVIGLLAESDGCVPDTSKRVVEQLSENFSVEHVYISKYFASSAELLEKTTPDMLAWVLMARRTTINKLIFDYVASADERKIPSMLINAISLAAKMWVDKSEKCIDYYSLKRYILRVNASAAGKVNALIHICLAGGENLTVEDFLDTGLSDDLFLALDKHYDTRVSGIRIPHRLMVDGTIFLLTKYTKRVPLRWITLEVYYRMILTARSDYVFDVSRYITKTWYKDGYVNDYYNAPNEKRIARIVHDFHSVFLCKGSLLCRLPLDVVRLIWNAFIIHGL